jgi:hypothetical protein
VILSWDVVVEHTLLDWYLVDTLLGWGMGEVELLVMEEMYLR